MKNKTTIKAEVECELEDGRLVQKFSSSEYFEHCIHGVKLRWSCEECEEFVDADKLINSEMMKATEESR